MAVPPPTEQAQVSGPEPSPADIAQMDIVQKLTLAQGIGMGLSGAHRTGKTSLCEKIAEQNAIPFVRTSARAVAEQHGFDVNKPGTLADRIGFQEILLLAFEEDYKKQNGLFITDRTPLDLAAYMLADVQAGEVDSLLDFRVNAYVNRCMAMAEQHFGMIVGIQPGIPFVPAEGVPAPNVGYQELLNAIIMGLGRSRYTREFYILDRALVNFDIRLALIAQMAGRYLSGYLSMVRSLPRQ